MSNIRSALLTDVDTLIDIEQRTNNIPWRSEHISDSVEKQQTLLVENVESGVIQAFLIGQVVADEATLLHIVVDKDYQSQGLGKLLLTNWLASLPDQVSQVWLEVRESNHVAQSLYRKHGFKQKSIRKNYYRTATPNEREDAVLFSLNR